MIDRIISFVEQHRMLQQGDCVTVGLSGGADSVALLYVMRKLAPCYFLTLTASTISFGEKRGMGTRLSVGGSAKDWESLCRFGELMFELTVKQISFLLKRERGSCVTARCGRLPPAKLPLHTMRMTMLRRCF